MHCYATRTRSVSDAVLVFGSISDTFCCCCYVVFSTVFCLFVGVKLGTFVVGEILRTGNNGLIFGINLSDCVRKV